MTKRGAGLVGASRLAIEAVTGITELVEAVHMNVLHKAIGTPAVRPVAGVTALAYRGVKGVTRLVGGGLDRMLGRVAPIIGEPHWNGRDALVAALNGVLGDRLARSGNPLAIPMQLRPTGTRGRIAVLVHGLCMNDQQWARDGAGHGAALERECGYSVVYLHYNTGRHISVNGDEFALQLQAMIDAWPVPVEELVIIGHSMGGLVARSACHAAAQLGHGWLAKLRKLVFLGTPHHGAPLERGGNWVHLLTDLSAYSAPFSRLAKLRSAGITDLRHGSLLEQDWRGHDRFAHGLPLPQFVPLPDGVQGYAVAGVLGAGKGGDGLVPLASALGQHSDPARCLSLTQAVLPRTNHMQLLSSPAVTEQLLHWLA